MMKFSNNNLLSHPIKYPRNTCNCLLLPKRYYIYIVRMFPQIAKRKKKQFLVDQSITKQWQQSSRDLQLRSKAALKRIPHSVLQDFGKVCRIKSIPEFYANYFVCSTQRVDPQRLPLLYAEEIQRMLTNNSHFHKINHALRQREELIEGLKHSLVIVEGFLMMNQNKNVPLQIKTSIDTLVSECFTLQELKDLERKKTEELAKDIIRIRTNTAQLVELVIGWRQDLEKNANEGLRKVRAIYPHQAINCLLMTLYDLLFIRSSALKTEISFGKDEHDPFLEKITKNKKGSQIPDYLLDYLKADTTDYSKLAKVIFDELPNDEADKMRQKEIEYELKKEQRAKEQKLKEEKLKQLREEKQKGMRIRHYSSVKTLKEGAKEDLSRIVNSKTSRGERSEKKIINIDKLIKEKSAKKKEGGQLVKEGKISENESKVLGAYKKVKKGSVDQSVLLDKAEILQQKKIWEKQMKQEKEEKEKIRKLLRQTEKKAMQETKQFQDKLKRYEEEVQNLKVRVQQTKKMGRIASSNEKSKIVVISPDKPKKSIASAYKSQSKSKDLGPSMLESKLAEQSKVKKNLEKQIKQLAKQKLKMEKLIEKESLKASKEVEMNKKQIEKYEEVINQLKSQTENSRKIIHQLETSKAKQEKKNADALKNSIIRQKEEALKKDIEAKIIERQRKKKAYEPLKLESPAKAYSRKKSLDPLKEGSESAIQSNKSGLLVDDSKLQILRSKLQEESRAKKSLESQIKQLAQEKLKLQKFIQRQNTKAGKEVEKTNKRIEKYEETINRLKQETEDSRRVISVIESSKIQQQKKSLEKSRVESVRNRELQLKRKIQEKIEERQRRKKAQKAKNEESIKSQERRLSNSKEYAAQRAGFSNDDIEIIKTKQTIEIVFEPKKRRRSHQSKELLQAEQKLVRLERERNLLEKKLQFSVAEKKEQTTQIKGKAVAERSEITAKFQEQIQRQREKNYRLEENIKKMRKNVSNQYELRLNKEKMKYQQEKEELLRVIQKEREEKKSKDRVLQQQMIFLKEMEKKENELFQLLQREKLQKQKKEMMLNRQLEQKQELMNMLQLQQIKKGIERQVRREIEENESQQQEQDQIHQQRKMKLEQQIQQLRMQKENEIEEMNNQNQKLRDLISQIKVEENNLLEAIKQNIEMESDTEREADFTDNEELVKEEPKIKSDIEEMEDLKKQNEQLSKELQSKTMIQFKHEEKRKDKYAMISNSEDFKDKEKIENLVEFYLKSPQQYAGQKQSRLKQTDKQDIIKKGSENARLIEQFQTQLFSLKEMPEYVPSLKNDSITNHLLNLRQAYEDYEADSLRRELFPPLQSEVYDEKQLSVQSQQPPMNTIMDQVRDHLKKHPLKKQEKGSKKNFLAINRVRLSVLEDVKKEKQRHMIEQESRKKIQKELFEKRRKQRQEKIEKERQKELEKEKNREEIYKKQKEKVEKEKLKQKKKKQEKSKRKKHPQQQRDSKSKEKDRQQTKKRVSSSKKMPQLHIEQPQEQITAKQNTFTQKQKEKTVQQEQEPNAEEIHPINEQQVQQNLQKQQAEFEAQVKQYQQQLDKRERQLLKEQVKQVQQQVRAYINEQQQFEIYQQFVSEAELLHRIQQLLDLSSAQIKNLNGNNTIKDDVPFYSTITILVAKNAKGIEVGLAVFHKQLPQGLYVCDYLIAHNMEHFLTLTFNFSRFLFKNDSFCSKIEFIFNLKSIAQPSTLRHFLEFEKKCRRLGEVYIKAKSQNERKYVLRRNLFESNEEKIQTQSQGINFNLTLQLCGPLLRQINEGFKNSSDPNYCSYSIILAYYLCKREEKLMKFRERAQNELIYRELLVTSLLFQKKELQIKNFSIVEHKKKIKDHLSHLKEQFDLQDLRSLQETKMALEQKLPKQARRCTLEVGYEQVDYLLLSPEEATTSIQSSNSSETGYFLSIVPKYKLMIIEAEEFLTMSSKNQDLTAFFYIKHFIKNIVDVKKEKFQRVYLPEIHKDSEFHFAQLSKKLHETALLKENIDIGWKGEIPNSVTFAPRHQDLVIQKPFIVALLSGAVQRAVEGSPICVQVVQ